MPRLSKAAPGLLAAALSCVLLTNGARAEEAKTAAPDAKTAAPKESKAAAPKKEEQAMTALKDMSTTLAGAKTLHFKVRGLRPFKMQDGSWVTLVTSADVMRDGKDKLFVQAGGDAFPFDFYYDGKTVTAYAPNEKVYAQRDAPPTIDATLEQAQKNGEVTIAFADVLTSDPYASMTKGLQSASVVGMSTLAGTETEHLKVHGDKMDWEIWISTKDHLPKLLALTDTTDARKPTHMIEFSEWKLDENLPSNTFSFNAPSDAQKVPFRKPGSKQMAAGRAGPRPGQQH
jgi:hypothetical protein